LKIQLKGFHKEIFEQPKKKNRRLYYLGIAATFLIIACTIYLFKFNSISNQDLFTAYFEPYSNLVTTRDNLPSKLRKGMESYSQGDFEKAIVTFNEIGVNEEAYNDMLFYKGMSYLALDLPNETIKSFLLIKTSYEEQLVWYSAMAFLNLDDTENTRKQLVKIKKNSFKYTEAQQLLEELEK
jgi:hypothetical protein